VRRTIIGQLVRRLGIVAFDPVHRVPAPLEHRRQLVVVDAREHGRVRDLVAVQVEDRQHGAVGDRIEELVRVPRGRERAGLRLAVADDAAHEEIGVVEGRAVRMRERVAELAALVDRAGRLGRDVRRDPTRERELPEQLAQAVLVLRDVGIHLGVRPLEVRVRDRGRPAVPRPHDVDGVEVPVADRTVHVRVDEVEPRRGAPVAEEAGLHVLGGEPLAQERVVEQVDLADGEVVRGAPVRVEQA
jgi:hypothetical protein